MKLFVAIDGGAHGVDWVGFTHRKRWYMAKLLPNGSVATTIHDKRPQYNFRTKNYVRNIKRVWLLAVAACIIMQYWPDHTVWLDVINIIATNTVFTYLMMDHILRTGSRGMHGAEHKVISAFEPRQEVPNLEEARQASRIRDDCGTIDMTAYAVYGMIVSIVFFLVSLPMAVVPIVILKFGHRLVGKLRSYPVVVIGRLFQRLTTAEPTDQELHLAISALNLAVTDARQRLNNK